MTKKRPHSPNLFLLLAIFLLSLSWVWEMGSSKDAMTYKEVRQLKNHTEQHEYHRRRYQQIAVLSPKAALFLCVQPFWLVTHRSSLLSLT